MTVSTMSKSLTRFAAPSRRAHRGIRRVKLPNLCAVTPHGVISGLLLELSPRRDDRPDGTGSAGKAVGAARKPRARWPSTETRRKAVAAS